MRDCMISSINADLHLGEAALVLVRLGEFDLPHLHGKISRQQHQLSDLQKRQVEHARSVQLAQTDYAKVKQSLAVEVMFSMAPHAFHVVRNSCSSESCRQSARFGWATDIWQGGRHCSKI